MIQRAIKKIFLGFLSLFLIISATFFLMHLVPGDPFNQDQALPEEILLSLKQHYGLDQPLHIQYGKFLWQLVQGDLGPSLKYEGRGVSEIIYEGFGISSLLGGAALFIAIGGGLLIGLTSATSAGCSKDRLFMLFSVIGISIPSFLMATFLQYLFAIKLDLLPVARFTSSLHVLLPALSLSLGPLAIIARLVRASAMDVLAQDYILMARAKGLKAVHILLFHVLRNAFLPVLTYLGPLTAAILTGGFAVEKIYGIPGLGQWFVQSILNRDYTVIMGLSIFYSSLLLFCQITVELLYGLLDPRIRAREATT